LIGLGKCKKIHAKKYLYKISMILENIPETGPALFIYYHAGNLKKNPLIFADMFGMIIKPRIC